MYTAVAAGNTINKELCCWNYFVWIGPDTRYEDPLPDIIYYI